jgi:hypothetical protein
MYLRPIQVTRLCHKLIADPAVTSPFSRGLASTRSLSFTGSISTKHGRDMLVTVFLHTRCLRSLNVEGLVADAQFLSVLQALHRDTLENLSLQLSFHHSVTPHLLEGLTKLRSLSIVFAAGCGFEDAMAWQSLGWSHDAFRNLTIIRYELSEGIDVDQQASILEFLSRSFFPNLTTATLILHNHIETTLAADWIVKFITNHTGTLQSVHLELPAPILSRVISEIHVPKVSIIHHNGQEWLGTCVAPSTSYFSIGEYNGPEAEFGHSLTMETTLLALFGRACLQPHSMEPLQLRVIQLTDFVWPKTILELDHYSTMVGVIARGFLTKGIYVVDRDNRDVRGVWVHVSSSFVTRTRLRLTLLSARLRLLPGVIRLECLLMSYIIRS